MTALVYVMAKPAVAGSVKTRLVPPLTHAQAADLAAALAADTLENLRRIAGIELRLALADEEGPDRALAATDDAPAVAAQRRGGTDRIFDAALAAGIAVEGQGGGGLGERMERLVARGDGSRPVVLVGTDIPDLPAATVEAAVRALDRSDAVLVPARDGGYVLVGAARPLDGLFDIDAAWGSERVFEATRASLARRGYDVVVLDEWEDVDDAAALGRLAVRLAGRGASSAWRTARLMEKWRREGVRF